MDVNEVRPVEFQDGVLRLLDQRALPDELVWIECKNVTDAVRAIKTMVVRGAPALGIAGAYAIAADTANSRIASPATLMKRIEASASRLRASRPTAVNLGWAIDRVLAAARAVAADVSPGREGVEAIRSEIIYEADAIAEEEENACIAIGAYGVELLEGAANVLTHCNAGALATGSYGTALGVIRAASEIFRFHVWIDETRPLFQGARLTAWELTQLKIPSTIIVDSGAGALMASGQVDAVVVGADRIASNGDVANKIGTYSLAVLAKHHKVPFYVAAPTSTIDASIADGSAIPIEERAADEIATVGGQRVVPEKAKIFNPAFDITPARLITAIITEEGVARPPYARSLSRN